MRKLLAVLILLMAAAPAGALTKQQYACAGQVTYSAQVWFHKTATPKQVAHLNRALNSGSWPAVVNFLDRQGILDNPDCPRNTKVKAIIDPEWRAVLTCVFRSTTGHWYVYPELGYPSPENCVGIVG